MTSPEQHPDKRFLLFESQIDQYASVEQIPLLHSYKNTYSIWSDRLVFVEEEHTDDFWNFEAFDLLMNETRHIRFQKTDKNFDDVELYSLDGEFSFIVEKLNSVQRFNIVKINWGTNEFELIEIIEQKCEYAWILIDNTESSKFALQWKSHENKYNCQLGKLVNGKIEIGETIEIEKFFGYYLKDKLIKIKTFFGIETKIKSYDLTSGKNEKFKIEQTSFSEVVLWSENYEWVNDRLYTGVNYEDTKSSSIAWADMETKCWNLMDVDLNLFIDKLWVINDNLIIEPHHIDKENGEYLSEVQFYSIPMRKPNHLRQKAWICVVQVMRKREEKDPYEAAKEFLPLNSDLREVWFKDVEEKKMEQMKIK